MIWLIVKPEGEEEPPYRYCCSHCGSLLLSVTERKPSDLPDKCPACGEGRWGEKGEGDDENR